MGKMNELDLCIQEVVQDNETLRAQVVEEIDMHLSGLTPFGELSFEAQRAIELFETQMIFITTNNLDIPVVMRIIWMKVRYYEYYKDNIRHYNIVFNIISNGL